jgi:hypothetical protein
MRAVDWLETHQNCKRFPTILNLLAIGAAMRRMKRVRLKNNRIADFIDIEINTVATNTTEHFILLNFTISSLIARK